MEEKFEREVLDRLITIETKMDMLASTSDKAEEAYATAMKNKEDISEMKERTKWLWRTQRSKRQLCDRQWWKDRRGT